MPAHTTVPPGASALSAAGTSGPAEAKISAPSSGSGGALVAPARPRRAQLARERLSPVVAGARECVDLPSLVDRHLADLMGGRAEAVQAQARCVARQPQGAVADQAAAQQWRRLHVGELVGQLQAEALIRDRLLGESPVDVTAGEARADAQVLAPAGAIPALPVGPTQPGNAHSPTVVGGGDDLMAENHRQLGRIDLGVAQVQVRTADRARGDAQTQLARTRRRVGHGDGAQRLAGLLKDDGLHG